MGTPLVRDMDFVRELLLKIESGDRNFHPLVDEIAATMGDENIEAVSGESAEKLNYHLGLLEEAGFVEFDKLLSGLWVADRITWQGHEFLDSIRDDAVWKSAKGVAEKVGSGGLSVLLEVAKEIGKQAAMTFVKSHAAIL